MHIRKHSGRGLSRRDAIQMSLGAFGLASLAPVDRAVAAISGSPLPAIATQKFLVVIELLVRGGLLPDGARHSMHHGRVIPRKHVVRIARFPVIDFAGIQRGLGHTTVPGDFQCPAFNGIEEVIPLVRVRTGTLAWLQSEFPDTDLLVLENEFGSDLSHIRSPEKGPSPDAITHK